MLSSTYCWYSGGDETRAKASPIPAFCSDRNNPKRTQQQVRSSVSHPAYLELPKEFETMGLGWTQGLQSKTIPWDLERKILELLLIFFSYFTF